MAVTGEQDWYVSGVFNMSFINLNDTFGDYINRAGLAVVVNQAENALTVAALALEYHVLRHEAGGADELTHNNLTLLKNDHHDLGQGLEWNVSDNAQHEGAAVHESGGALEIAHNNLTLARNDHHDLGQGLEWNVSDNAQHEGAAVHESGGALEITHNNLALSSDDHHSRYTDAEAASYIEGRSNTFTALQYFRGVEASDVLRFVNATSADYTFWRATTNGGLDLQYRNVGPDVTFDIISCNPSGPIFELGTNIRYPVKIDTLICQPISFGNVSTNNTSFTTMSSVDLEVDPRYFEWRFFASMKSESSGITVTVQIEVDGDNIGSVDTTSGGYIWKTVDWRAFSKSGRQTISVNLRTSNGSYNCYCNGFVVQAKYR